MNVHKASAGQQASFQKDTGQTVKAEAGKFDGQLAAAQSDQGWLKNTEMFMNEERKQIEELEKSQKQKSFERQQANAELALAMASSHKMTRGRNQANVAESLASNQMQTKTSSGQTAATRFNQSAEQLKGSAAEKMIGQKVMEQKGHLYNPGLAQALSENGKAQVKEGKSMTEMPNAGDTKATASESDAFSQTSDQNLAKSSKKSPLNMANFARQTGEMQNQAAKPAQYKAASPEVAQALQSAKAVSAAPPKQVAALAKPTGPAANQAVQTGTATMKQTEESAKEAPVRRATPQIDVKEVAGNVKLMLNRAQDEMTMKLNPQHLGKLEIRLKKDGDHMVADLTVQSKEAKEVLMRQLPELEANLKAQGIEVSSFDINLAEESFGFASNEGKGSGFGKSEQSSVNEARTFDPVKSENEAIASRPQSMGDSKLNIYA